MRDEAAWFEGLETQDADDPDYILYGLLYKATDEICCAMEVRGITEQQVATRAGMSIRQFRRFLQTPKNTQLQTVVRIATALGLRLELCIGQEGPGC